MMLYAGIRPHEVARLTWAQVDFRDRAIYILPRHSKTGGARRVTIHKPLMRIQQRHNERTHDKKICPANWLHHWQELRRSAGWRGKKEMASGCAAAYLCELSSLSLSKLCGAAVGNRTPRCLAATDTLCGSERSARCNQILNRVEKGRIQKTLSPSRAGAFVGKKPSGMSPACFCDTLLPSNIGIIGFAELQESINDKVDDMKVVGYHLALR